MAEHRILVTGGRGFVGSHLVDRLRADGWSVPSLDRAAAQHADDVRADVCNLNSVVAAMTGCEGVVHLAAVSRERMAKAHPRDCAETNVLGTVTVLEAARLTGISPWLLLASTRDVPDAGYAARSVYGASWLAAETFAQRYAEDYGLRVLTLRLSDVYGSLRDHEGKLLPSVVRQALQGRVITIRDEGQRFDFTWYEDVLHAFRLGIAKLGSQSVAGFEAVTICTGRSIRLLPLVDLVLDEVRRRTRPGNGCPGPFASQSSASDLASAPIWNDPAPARKLLGFQATVSLGDGIRRLVEDARLTIVRI